jgi:hypothetical protein
MTDTTIHTQPEPEHIAGASLALARVLAGNPDLETRLGVGAALAMLSDVHPPYPPHPVDLAPMTPDAGIAAALEALGRAGDSRDVDDAIRIGFAARELRQLLRVDGPKP